VTILHEAGRAPWSGMLYGVWAAEDAGHVLELDPGNGRGTLRGGKPFCTGAGMVDRALVTCRTDDGVTLCEIDSRSDRIVYDFADWVTPALAATRTATATFDGLVIGDDSIVGPTGWYLDRVGFWHGACGPAACWAGGAIGLVDRAVELAAGKPIDPHRDAHIGALAAIRWELEALLDRTGAEIDHSPGDGDAAAHRARCLRHLVDRAATEVIERFGRAFGPRPLSRDADVVRRVAELQLYVRQCHAERDLEILGRGRRAEQR